MFVIDVDRGAILPIEEYKKYLYGTGNYNQKSDITKTYKIPSFFVNIYNQNAEL